MFTLQVVHKWVPCHREVLKRSHVDKTIVLLKIDNKYVPIVESAVKIIEDEPEEAVVAAASGTGSWLLGYKAPIKEAEAEATEADLDVNKQLTSVSLPPMLPDKQTELEQGPQSLTGSSIDQRRARLGAHIGQPPMPEKNPENPENCDP